MNSKTDEECDFNPPKFTDQVSSFKLRVKSRSFKDFCVPLTLSTQL